MALKMTSAPFETGGESFDYLHLRVAVNSAPETDDSPFGCTATFRAYKLNGESKLFAPTDKVPLLKISIPDIEAMAMGWTVDGNVADAQLLAQAMDLYEQALALFIMALNPDIVVEVV